MPISQQEKIKILKAFEAGIITLSDLRAKLPNHAMVLYMPGKDMYRLYDQKEFTTKEEIDKQIKGLQTVLYLPDNGRDNKNIA